MFRTPLRALVALALGIAAFALLPITAAEAAVPTGPTAVAVANSGVTYVGFAAGGSLTRIDASGAVISPITLPRAGAVDGLAVDSADNVWVGLGYGAVKVSPTGAELAYIPYPGVTGTCPAADGSTDPSRYGGIAVSPTTLYVSGRCFDGIRSFALSDGHQVGGLGIESRTRGIAWIPAQSNGQAAKIFFAAPDSGKVYEYPEAWASNGGLPSFVLNVPQSGSNPQRPAGITADRYGQLAVADAANDHVLLFDTNNKNGPSSYSWYRTLGRTGSNAGDLMNPTALAQYSQDGPLQDRRGDFFVADTGNGRVQRWNTSGYTYWSTAVGGSGGGPAPTAPVNLTRPVVSGTPAVGQTLTCSQGTWSGSPTSFQYGWNRNGSSISGQNATTYVVQQGDAGQGISCFVRATNAAGTSDYATSDPVAIASTAAAPTNSSPPTITGIAEQGQTLTCNPGSWTGSPSFGYVWLRDGATQVGTGSSYVVQAADVGQAITCRVTATNAQGSTQATSSPVTPTAPVTCTGVAETVSINSASPYTNTQAVTLKAVPPAGATQVQISNDGGFGGATTQALTGSCSYPWTLSTVGGKATRVVYVRFLNGAGAVVGRASDDIILDAGGPALRQSTVSKVGRTFVVRVRASDAVSGVAKIQYAATRGARGTTVRYQARLVTRKPASFRWVRVYDRAGNASRWVRTTRR